MAEELKPCPFCGEATAYVRTNTSLGTAHVYCKTCQARGPLAEEGTAGWVWNGRTIKDTLRAENERLREENASLRDIILACLLYARHEDKCRVRYKGRICSCGWQKVHDAIMAIPNPQDA